VEPRALSWVPAPTSCSRFATSQPASASPRTSRMHLTQPFDGAQSRVTPLRRRCSPDVERAAPAIVEHATKTHRQVERGDRRRFLPVLFAMSSATRSPAATSRTASTSRRRHPRERARSPRRCGGARPSRRRVYHSGRSPSRRSAAVEERSNAVVILMANLGGGARLTEAPPFLDNVTGGPSTWQVGVIRARIK